MIMAQKNAYLAKIDAAKQEAFVVGCDITAQQMFDLMCIVLNDPDVMGKDVFGADRLRKVRQAMEDAEKMYHLAWLHQPESDYYQEKVDERLRKVLGEIEPFKKRYPYIREWNYNKAKRG
jgi:hypothetical protein